MDLKSLQLLYDYNAWANARVLDRSADLSQEQLLADQGASYPSLRDTLVHTMSAQWIWLSRWQGTSPSALHKPTEFPDVVTIRGRWDLIEADTQQFISELDPSRLAADLAYRNTRGVRWVYPLWQQMLHQVNHGTQHRSEAAMILTQFGRSPGDLDLLVYMDRIRS